MPLIGSSFNFFSSVLRALCPAADPTDYQPSRGVQTALSPLRTRLGSFGTGFSGCAFASAFCLRAAPPDIVLLCLAAGIRKERPLPLESLTQRLTDLRLSES